MTTYVQQSNGYVGFTNPGGTTSAQAFSTGNTLGGSIVVLINVLVQNGTPTPLSSDWTLSDTAGNSYPLGAGVAAAAQYASGQWAIYTYLITGIKAGANSVSATLAAGGIGGSGGSGGFTDIGVIEYPASAGLRTSNTAVNTGASAAPSVTLTGTVNGDICVQMFNVNSGSGLTTKGSFGASAAVDIIQSTDGGAPWSFQDGTGDGSSPMACTAGVSSTDWVTIALALKPAGATAKSDIVPMIGGGRRPSNSTYLKLRERRPFDDALRSHG